MRKVTGAFCTIVIYLLYVAVYLTISYVLLSLALRIMGKPWDDFSVGLVCGSVSMLAANFVRRKIV